ncbi:hypothetical protein D1007_54014 [Hordeum vulgare]|nr:hypothetical protein D1007_54014 [Hordeum vulgare]
MKKIKIEPKDDALYEQYVLSRYKIPKPKHGKPIPDFIEIEGFHTSVENFHSSLKPRAEIDSDIMTLNLKTFNLEQMYNRKKPKKYAFSVFMGTYIPNLRKRIVANLLKHRCNNLDPAEKLRKLLEV